MKALQQNSVRVIDLFREWDEDADGLVDKKEFRKAIAALGYDAHLPTSTRCSQPSTRTAQEDRVRRAAARARAR